MNEIYDRLIEQVKAMIEENHRLVEESKKITGAYDEQHLHLC